MITALASIAIAGVVGIACYVAYALLREQRINMQAWRARVNDLERERDDLINQVKMYYGVGLTGATTEPARGEYHDPETGNVHFSDGEIQDRYGTTLVKAGGTLPENATMADIMPRNE